MFKTPPIPKIIREIEAPENHINPLKFLPNCQNLFGTETLCGDWDGDLLLVAQDFAKTKEFCRVLTDCGQTEAWRHNDGDHRYRSGDKTNLQICKMLTALNRPVDLKGTNASECKTLYVNACFFLTDGKKPSPEAFRRSVPVLEFVLSNMIQLKVIACLGKEAFLQVGQLLKFDVDWKTLRDSRRPHLVNKYRVHALSHPGWYGTMKRLPKGATNIEKLSASAEDWKALSFS